MSDKSFKLEEATIEQLHNAIRNGEVTCKRVVEKYIERAHYYVRTKKINDAHDARNAALRRTHSEYVGQFL